MNNSDFNVVLENAITDLEETLFIKGSEYSHTQDRLKNFKDAADFNGIEPEQALWLFVTKHIIALKDFVWQIDDNRITKNQWAEKLGDIRAYMVLLEALVEERITRETV